MKYLNILLIIIILFHFQSCYVYIPKGYDVIIPFEHIKNYNCQIHGIHGNIEKNMDSTKIIEYYLKQQQTMEFRMNLLMQITKKKKHAITWNDLNTIKKWKSKAYYHNQKYGYIKLISSIDMDVPKLISTELKYSIPTNIYFKRIYIDKNLEVNEDYSHELFRKYWSYKKYLRYRRFNYPVLEYVGTPLGEFKFYVNYTDITSNTNPIELYAIRMNSFKYPIGDISNIFTQEVNMEYRFPIDFVDVLCLTDGSFSYNTSKAILYALYIQNMPLEYKRKKEYKIIEYKYTSREPDTLYRYSAWGNRRWFKPRKNSNCGFGAGYEFKAWQFFAMKNFSSTKDMFGQTPIRVHYPPYTGFFNRRIYYPYRGNPEYLNSFIYIMSWSKYEPEDVFFEKKHFKQFYYTFKSLRDGKNYRLHYNARNGKFVNYKEIKNKEIKND